MLLLKPEQVQEGCRACRMLVLRMRWVWIWFTHTHAHTFSLASTNTKLTFNNHPPLLSTPHTREHELSTVSHLLAESDRKRHYMDRCTSGEELSPFNNHKTGGVANRAAARQPGGRETAHARRQTKWLLPPFSQTVRGENCFILLEDIREENGTQFVKRYCLSRNQVDSKQESHYKKMLTNKIKKFRGFGAWWGTHTLPWSRG